MHVIEQVKVKCASYRVALWENGEENIFLDCMKDTGVVCCRNAHDNPDHPVEQVGGKIMNKGHPAYASAAYESRCRDKIIHWNMSKHGGDNLGRVREVSVHKYNRFAPAENDAIVLC